MNLTRTLGRSALAVVLIGAGGTITTIKGLDQTSGSTIAGKGQDH